VTTVQVGSQVSGQIKALLADFNTEVRRGQVIARIDPDTFEAKVNQARAEVEAAQAAVVNQQAQVERSRADIENVRAAHAEARAQTVRGQVALADARRDLDRKDELARRELIARSEHDTAQAAYDSAAAALDAVRAKEQAALAAIGSGQAQLRVAEAQLTSAQAQVRQKQAALRQAEVDLQHTTIRAPVDGVVVARQVDVGQTVAASLQAPVLFTIAQDLTKMQVDTSVDEADIGRIGLEKPVVFTVDAFPGRTFTGRVVQIRKAAQVVQNVVTYTVVVAVENPDGRLLPGMTANVKVLVAQNPNALKVPNAALRFRPPGDAGDRARAVAASEPEDGSRAPSVAETRERLVNGLALTPGQLARLDPILEDSRQQLAALRAAPAPAEARQEQVLRIRETTRGKIRELLSRDQQGRYDALTAGERRAGTPGRVFALGPDGKPTAIALRLGLSDGSATEVLGGDLAEGQEVIVGQAGGASTPGRPGGEGGPRLRL
jgi:HlyD family secretion protein